MDKIKSTRETISTDCPECGESVDINTPKNREVLLLNEKISIAIRCSDCEKQFNLEYFPMRKLVKGKVIQEI